MKGFIKSLIFRKKLHEGAFLDEIVKNNCEKGELRFKERLKLR